MVIEVEIEHKKDKITITANDDDDRLILVFIEEMYKDNLFIELVGFMADLFEKGVLKVEDNRFVVADNLKLIEHIEGYA